MKRCGRKEGTREKVVRTETREKDTMNNKGGKERDSRMKERKRKESRPMNDFKKNKDKRRKMLITGG